jgi:hypothetical protein
VGARVAYVINDQRNCEDDLLVVVRQGASRNHCVSGSKKKLV